MKLKIIFVSLIFLALVFPAYSQSDSWIKVYNDEKVTIEMQDNVKILRDNVGNFTIHWIWAQPRALKMAPEITYRDCIVKTDINFLTSRYKTTEIIKLFDSKGDEINFDSEKTAKKWAYIESESFMEKVYPAALDVFKKYNGQIVIKNAKE